MAISTDTTTIPDTTIVVDDTNTGIAIDYTAFYERIATAMETIATNSTTIATNSTTIAAEITTLDDHIERLKELGDHPNGPGIRTVAPYGLMSTAILYHLYVNQGQILEDGDVSKQEKTDSVNKYQGIINDLIKNFDPTQGGF